MAPPYPRRKVALGIAAILRICPEEVGDFHGNRARMAPGLPRRPEAGLSDDLVLCAGTLRAASIAEKCAAAVAGGFSALTLWPSDVARAKSEGATLAEIKLLIADHGLAVADLDALLVWLPGEAVPPGLPSEAEFYAIADGIGGGAPALAQGGG